MNNKTSITQTKPLISKLKFYFPIFKDDNTEIVIWHNELFKYIDFDIAQKAVNLFIEETKNITPNQNRVLLVKDFINKVISDKSRDNVTKLPETRGWEQWTLAEKVKSVYDCRLATAKHHQIPPQAIKDFDSVQGQIAMEIKANTNKSAISFYILIPDWMFETDDISISYLKELVLKRRKWYSDEVFNRLIPAEKPVILEPKPQSPAPELPIEKENDKEVITDFEALLLIED